EDRPTGVLRVAAINNMASSVLMPMFARFSAKYPEIELHVEVSNKYVSLAERQADVAIRKTNTPHETLVGTLLTKVASAVYGERQLRSLIALRSDAEMGGRGMLRLPPLVDKRVVSQPRLQFFCRRYFVDPCGGARGNGSRLFAVL